MAENSTEKKTITLRKGVAKELERVAREENRNFSNMVETVALNYLKTNHGYSL